MDSVRRSVRIANCSGAVPDPSQHMYDQAAYGPIDVITGDYLVGALQAAFPALCVPH